MSLNAVHKIIAVYLLGWVPLVAAGQSAVLDHYVEEALRVNPGLLQQQLIESERMLGVELASASRRPTVDLRTDYLLSAGGRSIDIPIGSLLNPLNQTVNGLTGSERLPTQLENVQTRFIPSNFYDSRVEVRLPLLQPLIAREEALRSTQVIAARAETATLANRLRYQVAELYYAYLQSVTGLETVDSSRQLLLELRRVNQVLVDNDRITRDAVYRTEAELAALDGQSATLLQQRNVARAALNRLLARDLDTPLRTDTNLLRQTPVTFPEVTGIRPELRQLDAGLTTLTQQEALERAGGLPTLGLQLQAGAQGFADGSFEDHPYATLGVGLSWSLYDGRKRQLRAEQIRVQREGLARQREDTEGAIALEVYQARQRIVSEEASMVAATAGIRASREAFRILLRRYRNDQALLVEYLDARTRLTTAELEYNLAYYRLLQARAALRFALGTP